MPALTNTGTVRLEYYALYWHNWHNWHISHGLSGRWKVAGVWGLLCRTILYHTTLCMVVYAASLETLCLALLQNLVLDTGLAV